jgi:hypothetical protein
MISLSTLVVVKHYAFTRNDIGEAVLQVMRRGQERLVQPPNHNLDKSVGCYDYAALE